MVYFDSICNCFELTMIDPFPPNILWQLEHFGEVKFVLLKKQKMTLDVIFLYCDKKLFLFQVFCCKKKNNLHVNSPRMLLISLKHKALILLGECSGF